MLRQQHTMVIALDALHAVCECELIMRLSLSPTPMHDLFQMLTGMQARALQSYGVQLGWLEP